MNTESTSEDDESEFQGRNTHFKTGILGTGILRIPRGFWGRNTYFGDSTNGIRTISPEFTIRKVKEQDLTPDLTPDRLERPGLSEENVAVLRTDCRSLGEGGL